MNDKKVSIVLPVYNGAKHIENAINSILNQSYGNIELIIVNDCSSDNTFEIISTYTKDKRVSIVNNETNQKLPKSLNIGFKRTTGEYLSWTSDDNIYHMDAIDKMVKVLDHDDDIDLVYSDFTIIDSYGSVVEVLQKDEPSEIRFKNTIGACFLYRRTLAEKVGEYNPDFFLAEDYDYFIRCYKAGCFYHLKENLYDYMMHEGSLTATKKKEIAHQTFAVMNNHLDYLLSECRTQRDKNRLFNTLLSLLEDPKEKKTYRLKLYRIDKSFAYQDLSDHFINSIMKRFQKKTRK